MSSPERGRGDLPGARAEPTTTAKTPAAPAAPADVADPYSNWLDRMQRARVRHAAITKNLYTWSNYKNWADKMRDSWEGDEPSQGGTGGAPKLPVVKK
jgi:hypothetical protein